MTAETPTPPEGREDLLAFIKDVESHFFRTDKDTGANLNAILIWNLVRKHAGLETIYPSDDLPQWNGSKYVQPANSKLLAKFPPYPTLP